MTIRFEARPSTIDKRRILRLPQTVSEKLRSRGQVAIRGTINGREFQAVLEPDGTGGHWMPLDSRTGRDGVASLEIEPRQDWPEPKVPKDLSVALTAAPQKIQDLWHSITPMARWEWVRWVNATRDPDTRRRRVEVSIAKMRSGKRRPCCFNLAACTDPDLARNGRLLEA